MKRHGGWNEEVTDAQGRRRFHGAFTGGFSAGFYNTVGSENGWQPSTFSSSRQQRAARGEQRIEDFMDEEDDPLLGRRLEASDKYDTLQTSSRQRVKDSVASSSSSTSAMLMVPEELIIPASSSIGKTLLTRMGWKEGHGIGPRLRRRRCDIGAEQHGDQAPEAEEETQHEDDQDVYVPPRQVIDVRAFPKPKLDKYGAGFDPFVNAPEFLVHKKRLEERRGGETDPRTARVTFVEALRGGSSLPSSSRATMGFGLSALEENDDLDVYETTSMQDFDRSIGPSHEPLKLTDEATALAHRKRETAFQRCYDGRPPLSGFVLATNREKPPKRVALRLDVPSTFRELHVFDETSEQVGVKENAHAC
ncbi:hypothetical protein ATCC90586_004675 [Pythium insidiosum]|nr:hypothetical protein ATCC90586_004675 [Pythium insidiosum]